MRAPIPAAQILDLSVRIAMADIDVAREVRELHLERLELRTSFGATLDEDVAIEARLGLQRYACRTVEQGLRLLLCEVGEQRRLRVPGLILMPSKTVSGAGKRVDVTLPKRVLLRRLVFESRSVARKVMRDHGELLIRPIAAEAVRLAAACLRLSLTQKAPSLIAATSRLASRPDVSLCVNGA